MWFPQEFKIFPRKLRKDTCFWRNPHELSNSSAVYAEELLFSGGNADLAVAVRLTRLEQFTPAGRGRVTKRLEQFIRSDLASIPVSAKSRDFSEEISERFQILADSEGFKISSEDSSEEMPFFFGNDIDRCE